MNRRQKLVQQQFLNNEKAIVDRLQYIYDQSLFDINKKIRGLEFQIGDLTEEYDWMDDNDPQKEIIRSRIQSKIYQKQYQEALQGQLDEVLKNMQAKQYLTVSDYLNDCYTDGFIGTVFDQHGQDVPLIMPIDQEAMVRAVQLDSKISQGLYTRLGEDVSVLKKRIASEVTRSIATGSSYGQVAKRLANQTKIGFNRAVRIARTEGHRIQCTAAMDAMRGAKDRGADVVKQWDATLDDVTRESHRHVDGQIRELNEDFGNGLEFPGDPAGGAAEVINCRCALLQRARWALDEEELQTLKDRAAYFGLNKSNEFDDFKKKYLKAVEAPASNTVPSTPLESCTNFNSLASYFSKTYGVKFDASVRKLHFESVKEAMQGMERILTEFPQAKSAFRAISTSTTGLMCASNSGTINFNPKNFTTAKQVATAHRQSSYHPKNNSPFLSGAHEMGHIVELGLINKKEKSRVTASKAWVDCTYAQKIVSAACTAYKKTPEGAQLMASAMKKQISGYAMESASECLAEGIADYVVNGEAAAPLSKFIWQVLKKEMG